MKRRLSVLVAALFILVPGVQVAYASPAPPERPGPAAPTCPARQPSKAPTSTKPSRPVKRTIEGTVRLVARDPANCGSHDDGLFLVSGTKSYALKGAGAAKARPNTRMVLSGSVSESDLTVETATTVSAAPGTLPTTGTTRVLVMLATWTQPDLVTPASARAQIFDEDHRWYQDASYQRLGLSGDVTPWLHIAPPANGQCFGDREGIMARAKTAASATYNLTSYDNFLLYFPENSAYPGDDCAGTAGFAYVGAPNTWINGYMDLRVTVHEFGHNYGLQHANSYFCSNADLQGTCNFNEYGDPYDAMGGGFDHVGHFNAYEKNRLGWFSGRTPVSDLTAGGSRTLVPLESSATGVPGIKVTATTQRAYWLEYRQALGFDSGLPTSATTGVLVHVVDPSLRDMDEETSMIDAYPNSGTQSASLQIRSGASWRSPEGFVFSVGALTSGGAEVTVAPADTVPPVLTSRTPAPEQTAVAVDSDVRATFSEPVAGVQGTTFTLKDAVTGAPATATVARVGTTNEWALNPTVDLAPSTRYLATLATGIRDLAGQAFVPQQWSFTTAAAPGAVGYHALAQPRRILDTRTGNGALLQIVPAGGGVALLVLGREGVPSTGVGSVLVNLTVTQGLRGGYATVYPAGGVQPAASTLNFPANRSVANSVIVKVGAGGKIAIATSATAHLIVDVQGYFQTGSDLVGLSPTRLLDTRSGTGAPIGIVKPAAPVQLQVLGVGGVPVSPSAVTAVIINVTATQGASKGVVTVYPGGGTDPGTSTVSYDATQSVATGTVAKVGSNGKITLTVSSDVHLIVDVQGYVTSETDLHALAPARIFNSRTDPAMTAGLAANQRVEVNVLGQGDLPGTTAEVEAVVVNVTADPGSRGGVLTVFPGGSTKPDTSTLNFPPLIRTSNSTIVKLGPDGTVAFVPTAGTHLTVDVVGFVPPGS